MKDRIWMFFTGMPRAFWKDKWQREAEENHEVYDQVAGLQRLVSTLERQIREAKSTEKLAAKSNALTKEHELRKAREELVKLDWYKAEVKRLDMLIEVGAEISEEFSRGAQAMKLLDEIVESEVLLEGPGGGNQCLHDRAVAIISEEGAA